MCYNNYNITFFVSHFTDPDEPPAKKKRRSRWGNEETRTSIPGLPTVIPPNMSEGQQRLYLSTFTRTY